MQYYNDVLIMDTCGDRNPASGFCLVEISLDLVELVCRRVERAQRLSAEENDLIKLVYHDRHFVLLNQGDAARPTITRLLTPG